jgi:hypothetical protein
MAAGYKGFQTYSEDSMKLRVIATCAVLLVAAVGCGKKVAVTNPALEKTARSLSIRTYPASGV